MKRLFYTLCLCLGLGLGLPLQAIADDPPAETTEEAAEAPAAEADAEAPAAEGEEAAAAPETDAEAVATATALLDAVKGKQWPLAVGLFLTLLVYGVNRFGLNGKVGEKVVPWLAGGVGLAGATATGLMTGEPVLEALTAGVLAAVAGVGGWEVIMKKVTGGGSGDNTSDETTAT